jgi:cytidine deaminase
MTTFETLRSAAAEAASFAYAPYSKFHVGAAARTIAGTVITAANVENVSYGLSLCAETSLCAVLVAGGGRPGDIVEVAVTDPAGTLLAPCGRCRQVLLEFGGSELLVNQVPLHVLLPGAFTPDILLDPPADSHGH